MSYANQRDASHTVDAVETLLAGCLEREPFERARALHEACSTHPELADDLRERWSALVAMGVLEGDSSSSDADFPEQLGDFRLLERIGGGGMGVVYLAHQGSLEREVALKLVRPEHLFFPRAKLRFQREAQAVAKLAHPGIVPIYTVGDEQGIPYFAMELVRGCTLAHALEELQGRAPESLSGTDLHRIVCNAAGVEPVLAADSLFALGWVELCLSLARQVADALEHAHAHGVLHRDIKPSNVMLTPDGRAMLLDFGLTAAIDADGPTRSGAQVGTLFYMSPEQVRAAERVDARTDVYGLGVTLYEMLTLQLPYRGADALETQRLILAGYPDSIRARNRRVRADVEVVCNVAIEVDPARRYASTAAFARDLLCLLEHRPIAARPPGAFVRAARFAQRRPALSTSLASLLVLLVATPSVLLWQSKLHAKELSKSLAREQTARLDAETQGRAARDAQGAADEARKLAARDAQTAEQSLAFLSGLFFDTSPYQRLGDQLTALDLLAKGTQQLQSTLSSEPAARARLQATIGRMWCDQGRFLEAIPLLEAAHEYARQTDDVKLKAVEIEPAYHLAQAWIALNEPERAAPYAQEVQAMRSASPDPEERAVALHLSAVMAYRTGQFADVDALVARELEQLALASGEEAIAKSAAAWVLLGQARWKRGELDAALESIQHALELQQSAVTPSDPEVFHVQSILASLRRARGELALADATYAECVELGRRLFRGGSDVLAKTLHNWAMLRAERGQLAPALELMREADAAFAELFGDDSRERAGSLYGVGRIELTSGHFEQAEATLEQARELLAMHPDDETACLTLGYALDNLAQCADHRGDPARSRELFELAIETLDHSPHGTRWVVQTMSKQAELARRGGRADEAERVWLDALDYADQRLPPDDPETLRAARGLAELYESRGDQKLAEPLRARLSAAQAKH